jgi:hypothetical protein
MRFRRLLTASLALATLGVSSVAAAPVDGRAEPGPGYFASDNVEWITNIPINIDSAGARIHGDYFYITTSNGLTIYDISEPAAPQRLGFLPMPQQPYFAEEDVDTNGKILLISTIDSLYVVDVEDKSNPTTIGEIAGADQHTYTCVLDCTYAYGSEGAIISLKDPTQPERVGDWAEGRNITSSHDVTEVSPGLIMTSTQPLLYLDARKNAAKPKTLAIGISEDGRFIHSNLWPNGGKDRMLLVGGESGGPTCDEGDGAFMTWSVSRIKQTHSFQMLDEYRVKNGLPTDGDAAANLYCTHWFDTEPGYKNGGLVAMGWYEHGTRFLTVSPKGKILEDGYFLPVGGSTSAAYWVNDQIVYAVDYNRGIDILRYDRPAREAKP